MNFRNRKKYEPLVSFFSCFEASTQVSVNSRWLLKQKYKQVLNVSQYCSYFILRLCKVYKTNTFVYKVWNVKCKMLILIYFIHPSCPLGIPVSYTTKTDCHDIAEILLKVGLNTITLTPTKILSASHSPKVIKLYPLPANFTYFNLHRQRH
jgi:hypothetical protein